MNTHRKRPVRPWCETLEIRNLLSSTPLTGTWIGQDQHDLVGRSSVPGPNGIQDIRIALDDLPDDLAVTSAEVRGHGGGIWTYEGTGTHWAAAFVRVPGSTEADVFFEPYKVEVGRPFTVRLWYEDGSTTLVSVAGGVADPTFRMPEATAIPSWVGQDGSDRVGPGVSVGPDGVQDAVVVLENLDENVAIEWVDVRGPGPLAWRSGANERGLPSAELIRDDTDPSNGRLFVQSEVDLDGLPITLTISYANGTLDIVELMAGPTDPDLAVPPPAELPIRSEPIEARWIGQVDDPEVGPGSVVVDLDGLPEGRTVVGGALAGPARGVTWAFRTDGDEGGPVEFEPGYRPLAFRADSADPTRASIAFPPEGNGPGDPMTLRLHFDDGSFSIVRFEAGEVDPSLRSERPEASEVVALSGDDLQSLVDAFGTIRLSAGEYALDEPLVLNRPVTISAEPGATLRFSQPEDAEPWPSAIVIHHGNTTLDGFAVRFDGPVRWDWSVPYDPAVIASTDPRTPDVGSTKVGLVLANLDLEGSPTAAPGGPWERSAALVNFVSAEGGKVVDSTLRGGTVRVWGGPWELSRNAYLGAMPGTWAYDVFAMSHVHDITVEDNIASPLPGSGKTYRFLVMTQDGSDIRVEGNRVEGLGPRDDDAQPHPNTPEVILTEAYRVNFEGMPSGLSGDGSILRIPGPQGDLIRSGDVVAVLSGPMVGQWRRVSLVIDQQTLLLDEPLPTEVPMGAVSISNSFVGLDVTNNTVDARGGSEASPLVLAGAHFDVEVSGNHLLGGADVRLSASASERTVHWGWTHTPMFDVRFASNTIEDSLAGLDVRLVRYPWAKSSQGRTYLDAEVVDNLFAWSPAFFEDGGEAEPPSAMLLGDSKSIGPLEARIVASGNAVKVPPGRGLGPGVEAVQVIYNEESVTSTATFPLPPQELPPIEGLRLVVDTGVSARDGITSDGRLTFDRPGWVVSSQYRMEGEDSYRPVPTTGTFLPEGLEDGSVTVFVRGLDDFGRPGPEAAFSFELDTTSPAAVSPRLGPGQDSGISDSDNLTRIASPFFQVEGDPGDTLVLRVDGREVARRVGPGMLRVDEVLADGLHRVSVLRVDEAGNATDGPAVPVRIDTTPPIAVASKLAPGQDTGISAVDGLTRLADPVFRAVIDNSDVLALLRDGREVGRITGSGTIRAGGLLPDGTYRFVMRRIDEAGNATDGPERLVTIDATPPKAVGGLTHRGSGLFSFTPMAGAVDYHYRVGDGPTVPTAGASTFKVRGLPFSTTPVRVRAIDAAGNLGREAEILAATPAPVGTWIGQRSGVDRVGPWAARLGSDGIQDVGLSLTGLPVDRSIVSAEVRGWGSGIWQHNIAGVHWRAALVPGPTPGSVEILIQPYQYETGRSYFVRLNFSDRTTVGVTIQGGRVDPTLRVDADPSMDVGGMSGGLGVEGSGDGEPIGGDPGSSPVLMPVPVPEVGAEPVEELPSSAIEPAEPGPSRSVHLLRSRARWSSWQERLEAIRAVHRDRLLARRQAIEEMRQAFRSRRVPDSTPNPTPVRRIAEGGIRPGGRPWWRADGGGLPDRSE